MHSIANLLFLFFFPFNGKRVSVVLVFASQSEVFFFFFFFSFLFLSCVYIRLCIFMISYRPVRPCCSDVHVFVLHLSCVGVYVIYCSVHMDGYSQILDIY